MNSKTQESYLSRIERVQAYIADHLDQDLDLDHLSEVACFSHYHFQRICHGVIGETVMQTVRRMRLHRAASELIRTSSDISGIADRAGYGSIEAFSRAFKSSYGHAPRSYRVQTQDAPSFSYQMKESTDMFDVEIQAVEKMKLAAIAHHGDYMEIGKTFDAAAMWATKNNLLNASTRSIGIYYDDPSAVKAEDLRSEAGFVVDKDYEDKSAGVRTLSIAGGNYAILQFKGPYAELETAYKWLFGPWLAESGYEAADEPVFECYLNDPRTTPPTELLTNICLPLKS